MAFASGVLVPKRLYRGRLPSSNGTLYIAPTNLGNTGNMAIIKSIWIANTDTVDRTYTLYHVEAGGTASDDNVLYPGITILAKSVERVPTAIILSTSLVAGVLTGDFIQGFADVINKVTVHLYGGELT